MCYIQKYDINKQIFIKIYIKICHRNHRIVKLCFKSSCSAPFVPQANHLASFIDRYVTSSVTLGAILPPPSKTMKSSICPTTKYTAQCRCLYRFEAFLSFTETGEYRRFYKLELFSYAIADFYIMFIYWIYRLGTRSRMYMNKENFFYSTQLPFFLN